MQLPARLAAIAKPASRALSRGSAQIIEAGNEMPLPAIRAAITQPASRALSRDSAAKRGADPEMCTATSVTSPRVRTKV